MSFSSLSLHKLAIDSISKMANFATNYVLIPCLVPRKGKITCAKQGKLLCKELLVVSSFHNLALLQNHDLVSLGDGTEA